MIFKRTRGGLAVLVVVSLAAAFLLVSCGRGNPSAVAPENNGAATGTAESRSGGPATSRAVTLRGAGASFPYPLYSKWIEEYKKVKPEVVVDYQSIGSGGGIKGITEQTLDFAGSDAPMTDEQLARAPGRILHIPAALGAVVVAYNLPGIKSGLKLDGPTVAAIFLGKIAKWNDPRLSSLNPGLQLPERPIVVVHRSDGSGTTNVFTDYLSRVSEEWQSKVGKGTSVAWPVGLGAKGNEGVAGQIAQIEGAVGYVELAYAVKNNLSYAYIKNRAGRFVEPSLETTTAAAAGSAAGLPEDLRMSIVDAPGENAYPIAAYTYLLVYQQQKDATKGKALVEFLEWALHEGQRFASDLLYAPLPDGVVREAKKKIESISL